MNVICESFGALLLLAEAEKAAPAISVGNLLVVALQAFILFGIPGMLGGLLYSTISGTVAWPKCTRQGFRPGFVADMLFGLVGGFAVFVLLPTKIADLGEFQLWEFAKVFAIAAAGGFGGRPILMKLLGQLSKEIEEVKKKQEEETEAREERQNVTKLVAQQLDEGQAPVSSEAKLIEEIAKSPLDVRVDFFTRAREARRQAAEAIREGGDLERRALMDRVIPVWRGLIAADKERQYHRNFGQLGYALKDREKTDPQLAKNDYQQAIENFDAAIEIRDRLKVAGFKLYEFNRAICAILLSPVSDEAKQKVLADLKQALSIPRVKETVKREMEQEEPPPYAKWLKDKLTASEFQMLGLQPPPAKVAKKK